MWNWWSGICRSGGKPLDAAQLQTKIQELNERLHQMGAGEEGEKPEPAPPSLVCEPQLEEQQVPVSASPPATKPKKHKTKAQQLRQTITQLKEEILPRLRKYQTSLASVLRAI